MVRGGIFSWSGKNPYRPGQESTFGPGRPVEFYMEANEHNIAGYWEKLNLPVLVIYGAYDWIMSREDHLMIAEIMNKKSPGSGTYFEMPGMDHQFNIYPSLQEAFSGFSDQFDPAVARKAIEWLDEVSSKR